MALWLQVLAGALQDNKRAAIAGERTFGKGLIQTVVALSDGGSCPLRAHTIFVCMLKQLCKCSSCRKTLLDGTHARGLHSGGKVSVTVMCRLGRGRDGVAVSDACRRGHQQEGDPAGYTAC